ncbi:MAG: Uma2 family endonuclease [Xenococcus sp. MO_188.B8]|nr:Uma2 family endonuclease [Xenococcus sp. MO_188.B8]
MAFVRTKTVKGRKYRYLVENYREKGKVRQRIIEYLGAVEDESMVTTPTTKKITFEEYLNYEDGTNNRYELVNGELVLMPPASFLHSDIIDFIADLFKALSREHKLDIKVKTGDVGVRTGVNSSRIPDISVIEGEVWRKMPRDASAVIEVPLILAVEVVSPGAEQIERDYTDKAREYQNSGIREYWIVDPIEQKITVLVLDKGSYDKAVFTGDDVIGSPTFPQLNVTASGILSA